MMMLRRKTDPKTGKPTLCASLGSHNARGHFTRDIFVEISEGNCQGHLRGQHCVLACTVEMHMEISQEACCEDTTNYNYNYNYFTLHYTNITLRCTALTTTAAITTTTLCPLHCTTLHYTTAHNTTSHYSMLHNITLHSLHHTATATATYTNCITLQLHFHYATGTVATAVQQTTSRSCGWGDHCNHC